MTSPNGKAPEPSLAEPTTPDGRLPKASTMYRHSEWMARRAAQFAPAAARYYKRRAEAQKGGKAS